MADLQHWWLETVYCWCSVLLGSKQDPGCTNSIHYEGSNAIVLHQPLCEPEQDTAFLAYFLFLSKNGIGLKKI